LIHIETRTLKSMMLGGIGAVHGRSFLSKKHPKEASRHGKRCAALDVPREHLHVAQAASNVAGGGGAASKRQAEGRECWQFRPLKKYGD
jgi:hypothetical protein